MKELNQLRLERMCALMDQVCDQYETGERNALVDLLADLRHWANHCGISYVSADRTAHEHYMAEWQGR